MDANALYYTLSTIAQTLAGALAVLVAFVVLKLADLDRAIHLAQYELQGRFGEWAKLWDALCVGGLKALDEIHTEHHERIRAAYHEGGAAWRLRPRIIRVLSCALIASVVDVGACFAALPCVPWLVRSEGATLLVSGTVSLGIICLALYVWLIFMVVQGSEAAVPAPPK